MIVLPKPCAGDALKLDLCSTSSWEERWMDFNTGGGSGRPDDRPLFGGETGGRAGGPAPGPAGSPGREFNLQDPVNSYIGTVRTLVLDPVGFFRGIPRQGNFVNPLIFAVICAVINGVLGGIIGFLVSLGASSRTQGVGASFVGFISNIILAPVYAVIALFIGAAIWHLLVMLFVRPSNAGFEATFRVASYIQVYQLISWIPIIGWIVGPIYGIVLSIFGIREVHATTTGKAALVILIPVAVVLILILLLGAALVAVLAGSQQL